MLSNNKCVLVYGLSKEELTAIKKWNHKVIEITPEMCDMTITDIIDGFNFLTINNNILEEKAILYNNFPDNELRNTIKETRDIIKGGILAIITPTSIKWKFNYLLDHLIEERDWYAKRKGSNT